MTAPDFWLRKDMISMARSIRLAIVQNQLDIGNLAENKARSLLMGPLTPGDDTTYFDDSEWLSQYDKDDPEWYPLDWVDDCIKGGTSE